MNDAYTRLREATRKVAIDFNIDADEFDAELPPAAMQSTSMTTGPSALLKLGSDASTAATLLRSLAGFVEGMIEAVVLDQQITMEQVQAARKAARQPPGFR